MSTGTRRERTREERRRTEKTKGWALWSGPSSAAVAGDLTRCTESKRPVSWSDELDDYLSFPNVTLSLTVPPYRLLANFLWTNSSNRRSVLVCLENNQAADV